MLADFVHSYVYESVPVAVLCRTRHEHSAIQATAALDSFSQLRLYGRIEDDGVCVACGPTLITVNVQPTTVCLMRDIIDAQVEGDDDKSTHFRLLHCQLKTTRFNSSCRDLSTAKSEPNSMRCFVHCDFQKKNTPGY